MTADDSRFLEQFEAMSLAPEEFNHRGHLRLAWLYLDSFPLEEAIQKTSRGIAAYASHLGANDKFHCTLTEAIMRIIAARMAGEDNVETFLSRHPELVSNMNTLLAEHYSDERLNSDLARTRYITPHRAPFTHQRAA